MAVGRKARPEQLWSMAIRQSGIALVLVAPLSLGLLLAAPAAIPAWLPAYAPSVPTLQILAVGMLALVGGGGFSNLLVATGRSNRYLTALVAAVTIHVGFSVLFVQLGFGIAGIALAASIAFFSLTAAVAVAARTATLR
jgi:O-antigen/teichoic acid export membrane protein